MRFHEVPKRSLFSVPFKLGDGLTIGIKGRVSAFIPTLLSVFLQFAAGMVWSQNKRKEHINILSILEIEWKSPQFERHMWTRCEPTCSINTTSWYLQDRQADIDKTKIVYGADLGASADGDEDNEESTGTFGARVVKAGSRVSHPPHDISGIWRAFPRVAVLHRRGNPFFSHFGSRAWSMHSPTFVGSFLIFLPPRFRN